ncbi:hypothetical protein [Cesiribacter sp. SM1]|uniref:hypothetical protein n=1 Tax=Cesiribacter sp. SM1 TaxID=2861196 RepID=UPI001CD3BDAF|nr:hypothetical protein [Cesiribacter sp. SM1]
MPIVVSPGDPVKAFVARELVKGQDRQQFTIIQRRMICDRILELWLAPFPFFKSQAEIIQADE